jgi:phosphate-selective porin OprO/OprP
LDVDKKAFPIFASSASSAQQAQAWSVGVNWYLNRDVRAGASFSHTLFDGYTGGSPAVAAQPENAIFTRIQLAF